MRGKFDQNKASGFIRIRGARVHNLKNIDVDIPKNKLVVITGLSGSGKSSLAFDTIYAEAERRFVESLSSYARQFLGIKEKPDVESIEGLTPAISIDQKSISKNPRSTVGTITEIYDYLRILFARIGKPHCPNCGKSVSRQSVDQIMDSILRLPKDQEIFLMAPLIRGIKGEHKGILDELKRGGFIRARINGEIMLLDEALTKKFDKNKKHSIEVMVDRFALGDDIDRPRIRDSVEMALKTGKGMAIAAIGIQHPASGIARKPEANGLKLKAENASDIIFSEKFACTDCGISLPDIEPRTFSFNSPYGACPECTGLGSTLEVDPELVFHNKKLTIAEGAIRPWASASHRVGRQSWYWWILDDLATRHKFSLNTPIEKIPQGVIDIILYGEFSTGSNNNTLRASREATFEGVIPNLKRRWKETDSDFTRAEIEKYMIIKICPQCRGARLRPEALAVKIGDNNISEVSDKTIEQAQIYFNAPLKNEIHSESDKKIAAPLIKEILKRLEFLQDVGLEYLTISRESTTLAGGEAQRIQLATQIGSRLTGITYILDEPSIGLHPRDHARLIQTLKNLRDLGNTVIVVEHDAETMRNADWIIDLGPGAGKHGGNIIFTGTPAQIFKAKTLTGDYLSGRKKVEINSANSKLKIQSAKLKSRDKNYLVIKGASEHNLKNIDIKIPLGKFVCVSGVSGSGKSTLINDILAKALLAKFYRAHLFPGKHKSISGTEHINKVVVVDQSPIGRTPRSNPATYTGAFGFIRGVFAKTIEARARGYTPGRFSFNVKGGRCEQCEGQGVKKIGMYFLPDVYVDCEECRGLRYNREALEIEYNGKNIAQVLDMSIEESLKFFEAIPAIKAKLETLADVGLGYVKLGQPAPTLSGGEAQRVKLATELSRRDTGKSLYILDEPTTGLHFEDIRKLLMVLRALVDRRNTVLVIEHNLDVLRNSDWIIDLGPAGGEKGGEVIVEGSPAEIKKAKRSYTGQWLLRH
ncbi:MAG: excinuclease ABC subunit UvrA [Candidatus Sungbacteria bacterium]|nr:excinuclease ABC subunit UvrA [Candidatus Sungbacteria bacterium]